MFTREICTESFQPGIRMYGELIAVELLQDLKCIMGVDHRELVYKVLTEDIGIKDVTFEQFVKDVEEFETSTGTCL